MNKLRPLQLLVCDAALCWCAAILLNCSSGDLAAGGSAGESGNARVSGILVDSSGLPIPYALVSLLPIDYDPVKDTESPISARSDSAGQYRLEGCQAGSYNVASLDPRNGNRGLLRLLVIDRTADSVSARVDTLKSPGSLLIPLTAPNLTVGGYLFVPGTTSSITLTDAQVDAQNVVLDSIPFGLATTLAFKQNSQAVVTVIDSEIEVPPGDASIVGTVPAPWQALSIGETGQCGSVGFGSDAVFIAGGGPDIWGLNDGFLFVYQPLIGNGSISTRVISQEYTHGWAKAGVMIRASTSPGSPNVAIDMLNSKFGQDTNSIAGMHARPTIGDTTRSVEDISGVYAGYPHWVRLARMGDTLTGYESADGVAWNRVGSCIVALGDTALIGLAVTSRVAGKLNTAQFDNVSVTP